MSSANIKTAKKNIIKTTLDTLHMMEIKKMTENENELEVLKNEKMKYEDLLKKTKNSNNDFLECFEIKLNSEQIDVKLNEIESEIKSRQNKNEFLDYFLDTGDILYKYYDIQE